MGRQADLKGGTVEGAPDPRLTPVGKYAEAVLMGINGKHSAFHLVEDVVKSSFVFQAGTVSGRQGECPDNGVHLTRIDTHFMDRTAAGVRVGTS